MQTIRSAVLAVALAATALHGAWAQAASGGAAPLISRKWHVQYDVAADGRATKTVETLNEIAQPQGLELAKVFSFSFNSDAQTGEVLEAFTLKKDGTRISVPPADIQAATNQTPDGAAPAGADRTGITVSFRDLAVGDAIGVRFSVADHAPVFPGQFSMALALQPENVYQDVQITVRAPRRLPLRVESHRMEQVPGAPNDDIRTLQWRYQNLRPAAREEGIWRMDEYPSVIVSSFDSYAAIAQAYGRQALPKAQPTDSVRALAHAIVLGEKNRGQRARLLYEWVSRNIRYSPNPLDVGATVPRDPDAVLDSRRGDDKDHATLLQALLTANGIRSEQVLVNANALYDLPMTPAVSLVNHVMNYLPDLDLYVDATAKDVPFSYLPWGSYAKPVVHIRQDRAVARIPDQRYERTEQRLNITERIDRDGSASGELRVALRGLAAAQVRAYMRNMDQATERDFVKRSLAASGLQGEGTLDKGDTQGLSAQYTFRVRYRVPNYLAGGTSGRVLLAPVIASPLPLMAFADTRHRVPPKRRQPCIGFSSYENYDITLAPGIALVSLPPPGNVRSDILDFTAAYQRTPAGLHVERSVQNKAPASICSLDMEAALYQQALPVAENLQAPITYQRQSP